MVKGYLWMITKKQADEMKKPAMTPKQRADRLAYLEHEDRRSSELLRRVFRYRAGQPCAHGHSGCLWVEA